MRTVLHLMARDPDDETGMISSALQGCHFHGHDPGTFSLTNVMQSAAELDFRDSGLPGGSFVAAVNDRTYMQLSDRGSASNLIGDRWADICAREIELQPDLNVSIRAQMRAVHRLRLDDIPAIARLASRSQLQNPDFLLIGEDGSQPVIWASDAKFSVDTARSKQVSREMLSALLGHGGELGRLLGDVPADAQLMDGTFLCPDYSLTHLLLRERRGPRRATVRHEEVRFVQVDAADFLAPLSLVSLQRYLADLDRFPFDHEHNLLVGLYYFRLARAAVGCWLDQSNPLLSFHDEPLNIDEDALQRQARSLVQGRKMSAWGLLLRWNDLAEVTRQQRLALDRASAPPINGRRLKEMIDAEATRRQVVPPSGSKVRRLVGSWVRAQVRQEFGPMFPPVNDFEHLLERVSLYSRSLAPAADEKTRGIVEELLRESPSISEPDGTSHRFPEPGCL